MRTSLSLAVIMMVLTEYFSSTSGVGYVLLISKNTFQLAPMWAAIVLIGRTRLPPERPLPASSSGACSPGTAAGARRRRGLTPARDHGTWRRRTAPATRPRTRSPTSRSPSRTASSSASSGPRAAARRRCSSASRGLLRPTQRRGPPARQARHRRRRRRWRSSSRSTAARSCRGRPCGTTSCFRCGTRSSTRDERKGLVEESLEAVGLTRLHRPLPVAALGRHAAAGGDRPGAGVPAVDPAHGRAVRVGGRPDARRPGGPRAARARGVRHHDPVRDARHRRVGLPRATASSSSRTRRRK